MMAMPFMRRPRLLGKSSDDSARSTRCWMLRRRCRPCQGERRRDARDRALDAVAKSLAGQSATSADDSIGATARCPSIGYDEAPDRRLPEQLPGEGAWR